MSNIVKYYYSAREYVVRAGFQEEIDWVEHLPAFASVTPEQFFIEYAYVVLNAGMKQQVAERIFRRFVDGGFVFDIIGHEGKRNAIMTAWDLHSDWLTKLKAKETLDEQLAYLETLPWIGKVTKYHLARNLGLDVVKPDRHLVRLAREFEFDSPERMCEVVRDTLGVRLGVVDLVLWRYCNLTSR